MMQEMTEEEALKHTPRIVMDAIYQALDRFGFKGGNILEPAMGIGNFYSAMPEEMKKNSNLYVLLSRASGDSIEINIPDLSPVTVSKITVNDIEQLEMVTESTQTEETPEALVEEESSNTGFRIAMYILLIVAIGGLAALFFIAKKRNGGSIPFKRN